jgi:hypothetical protein
VLSLAVICAVSIAECKSMFQRTRPRVQHALVRICDQRILAAADPGEPTHSSELLSLIAADGEIQTDTGTKNRWLPPWQKKRVS